MDDLISRQMLLEYIHGEPVGRLLCDKYNLDGLIEQFPPAQPEQRSYSYGRENDAISRQAAIDAIFGRSHEIIKMRIGNLPSAQPERILCKDCKHHRYENGKIPYCDRIDYGYGWKDDDFCSRAERRFDEEDNIS